MKLLEFETMTEAERLRLVREVYHEAVWENVHEEPLEPEEETEALRREEQGFIDFFQTFLAQEKNRYYVLEAAGRWVSALRLTRVRDFYYMEALETAPEEKRKGYAAHLINEVIRLLEKRGAVTIRSNVHKTNIPSLAVHEKCGFVIEEENGTNHLTGKVSQRLYGMCYRQEN